MPGARIHFAARLQRTKQSLRYDQMSTLMTDPSELADRLHPFAEKIERWREDAVILRGLVANAAAANAVDPDVLLRVEEVSGAIYQAIADFDALVAQIGKDSAGAAGELAVVGDALRLVLMEITELGTQMYSVRSHEAPVPEQA